MKQQIKYNLKVNMNNNSKREKLSSTPVLVLE